MLILSQSKVYRNAVILFSTDLHFCISTLFPIPPFPFQKSLLVCRPPIQTFLTVHLWTVEGSTWYLLPGAETGRCWTFCCLIRGEHQSNLSSGFPGPSNCAYSSTCGLFADSSWTYISILILMMAFCIWLYLSVFKSYCFLSEMRGQRI